MEEQNKRNELKKRFLEYAAEDVVVAFSGGADSSLILKMACEAAEQTGKKVYAVTMQTKLHPIKEIERSRETAKEIGAAHFVLQVDELSEAGILNNPKDRCYLCKKCLFLKMKKKADELGAKTILDGTNEDDLHVYRPGLKALKELGIASPFAESGITKEEVRAISAEYGLSTADTPAAPCLATRFPYGTVLSYEKLALVEQGEQYLKQFGFYNLRLRVHGDVARIEVDPDAFERLLEHREEITTGLKELGYAYVTLDLLGFRSGSMDEQL